ncbi:nucleolin-like isoform X2 [Dreissena polymorpha]|uniref:nucleolin-like isoform X2 n=1 Tax=Dreissena polymorpha TaxID=45954 RepID=UPI002263E605|nr:nucleolin-like isoform X2 [Dreissena polymorpha]
MRKQFIPPKQQRSGQRTDSESDTSGSSDVDKPEDTDTRIINDVTDSTLSGSEKTNISLGENESIDLNKLFAKPTQSKKQSQASPSKKPVNPTRTQKATPESRSTSEEDSADANIKATKQSSGSQNIPGIKKHKVSQRLKTQKDVSENDNPFAKLVAEVSKLTVAKTKKEKSSLLGNSKHTFSMDDDDKPSTRGKKAPSGSEQNHGSRKESADIDLNKLFGISAKSKSKSETTPLKKQVNPTRTSIATTGNTMSADEDKVKEADEFMDKVITLMNEHPVVPPSARPDKALFEQTHELRKQLMAGQFENEQQKEYAKQRSMLEIVGWVIKCRLERILGTLNGDQANQLIELIVNGGLGGLGRDKGTDPPKQLKMMLEELQPEQVKLILNGFDATQLKQILSGINFARQFEDIFRSIDGAQLRQLIRALNADQLKEIVRSIDEDQLRQLVTNLNADQLTQMVNHLAGEKQAKSLMQAFGGLLQ